MSFSLDFTLEGAEEFLDSLNSPEYHPVSPKLWIDRSPINQPISSPVEDPDDQQTPSQYISENLVKRKRKQIQQKAEQQFDFGADPADLGIYCQLLINEPDDMEIDIFSNEEIDSRNDVEMEDDYTAENCAIMNLIVAQNNCSDLELQKSLIHKVDFPDHLFSTYCSELKEDFEKAKSNNYTVEFTPKRSNEQLYYERRLINSLILRYQVDQQYMNSHFPIDSKLVHLKIQSLYNDDINSWTIIKSRFQDICESSTTLSTLFYGKDWKYKFQNLLRQRKCINMQLVAICTELTCFTNQYVDRSLRIADINPELYGNCKFKCLTISELFSKLGINFFSDYCAFSFMKDRIMNHFMYTHEEMMEKVKRDGKLRKKIKKIESNNRHPDPVLDSLSNFFRN